MCTSDDFQLESFEFELNHSKIDRDLTFLHVLQLIRYPFLFMLTIKMNQLYMDVQQSYVMMRIW